MSLTKTQHVHVLPFNVLEIMWKNSIKNLSQQWLSFHVTKHLR